ncbi:hypothetical protein B0H10DRAFT_2041279 [Mycena sp. CBHHK59/15]|nr:hypothetical protein B0H10DRAFT_2041279 [Mycena sp. CBHHK59/15]
MNASLPSKQPTTSVRRPAPSTLATRPSWACCASAIMTARCGSSTCVLLGRSSTTCWFFSGLFYSTCPRHPSWRVI